MVAGVALRARLAAAVRRCSAASARCSALAALNPDAWIAERNLDRYDETGEVDWTYLPSLSDDASRRSRDLPDDLEECAIDLDGRTTTTGSSGTSAATGRRTRSRRSLEGRGADEPVCARAWTSRSHRVGKAQSRYGVSRGHHPGTARR